MTVEYKVRPRGGAFVTRFEALLSGGTGSANGVSSSVVGEFPNHDLAALAAKALAASEPGATYSANILGTPDGTAADLLRNCADQYGADTVDGLVILIDAHGAASVFGLGKQNECMPAHVFRLGAEKMRELGVL